MNLSGKDNNFSELLEKIENDADSKIKCDKCNRMNNIPKKTTIIKLPDILIFTLNRTSNEYENSNKKVKIMPDKEIDMKKYIDNALIDKYTKYKLFAMVLKENNDANFRYISEININKKFNINDDDKNYLYNSYGLFYRRDKNS